MATFQQAYDAVAERYPDKLWTSMDAAEISRAIYREMGRMDAKDAAAAVSAPAKRRLSEGAQGDDNTGHTEHSGLRAHR
jgi:hypothetical protein